LKVVLNLYLEEIHVIAKNPNIRSLSDLAGKKVAVGPEKSGSALTGTVLLAVHNVQVEKSYDAPTEALRKLETGELDALIFVAGAPVPAFEKLDKGFHFVQLPASAELEQIYVKTKIGGTVYTWSDETETYAVPSVIMTRARNDAQYATTLQKLVLSIITNKENLDSTGHPKWKTSFVRTTLGNVGYRPTTDLIGVINALDSYGYRLIKK
jgi:TRAP transporter TAXI family solute receptor